MTLPIFLAQSVSISLSGVMAPGPVTAVNIGKGMETPHAGAYIALGHGVVEFPLMAAIYFGLGSLFEIDMVKAAIFLLGGLFLMYMGAGMYMSLRKKDNSAMAFSSSAFKAGIYLSAGNPYFLVWWATVGAALIMQSAEFGWQGVLLFAIFHWLCDLVWGYFLSVMAYKGGKALGDKFIKGIYLVCGTVLLFFGGKFIYNSVIMLL